MSGQNYIANLAKTYFLIIAFICNNIVSGQPIATFSANTVSGCTPFSVTFRDNSTGNPTSWLWNLGNGTISGLRNPSATYFTPGVYSISLTVTNQYGSSTLTRTAYIKVYDNPVVNFGAASTIGCLPLATSFTDLSTSSFGSLNKWEWDFNDGDTSLQQNPVHTFATANNYAITLKVTNTNGCATVVSKPQFIKVGEPARAAFNFTPGTNCRPPETISFTNLSTGPGILSYVWDFGDTTSTAVANPFHTYLAGGVYPLQLIATSTYGCADTLTMPNALTIKNVTSAFASVDSICAGVATNFINTSMPVPQSSLWSFGDGSFSTVSNASKSWNTPGNYTVKLLNNFGTCTDSVLKTIRVMSLPISKFRTADTAGCKAPFTVNFTDQSVGAVSWLWNFGDGNTSSLPNPTYIYNSRGNFTVSLTVTNSNGCAASTSLSNYIKIIQPVISINGLPFEGCIPLTVSPVANIFSADGVASYYWDFGNGLNDPSQNPSTTYTLPGNYDIKLIITTNQGCTDSVVAVSAVHTGSNPLIDFVAAPLTQCAGQNIQFTDLSSLADKWEWHFGDSTLAVSQNPLHVYNDTGQFTIKLIAWNNGCKDSLTKTNYVKTLPPVAKFLPVYNCSNRKEISFTDISILPQSWQWDFGDGTNSTDQNPVHTFPLYQIYIVSLTVTNGNCSNTKKIPVHLINEQPIFTVSKTFLCKSDSVIFKALNINSSNIAQYQWDFGDNNIVSTSSPDILHQYLSAGVYDVLLKTTDLNGCTDSVFKPGLIHIFGPKAGFTAAPLKGCVPTPVTFTDTSNTDGINNLSQWQWNYGDGQTQTFLSALPSLLSHTYTGSGSFIASLKVTDSIGCSDSISYTAPIFITKPVAGFASANINSCVGSNVTFSNNSLGSGLNFLWSFGDGNASTTANPTKQYLANGNYTVKLIVTDVNGCKDSTERLGYIKVQNTYALFTQSDSVSSCTPFRVKFTNTSLFSVSQKWDFGDGSTSTLANPVHYFSTPGTYTVRMQSIRSPLCISTTAKQIVVYPPSARLTYSPLNGCAPLNVSFHIATPGQVSFLWDFNDGTTLTSSDSSYVYTYTLPGVFIPKIILKDSIGCLIPVTGADTIRMYSSKVNFGVQDSLFCDSSMVAFTDSTISGSTVTNYAWNFGDGTLSNLRNPLHNFTVQGLYSISLHISTIFGCNDSAVRKNYIKIVQSPKAIITGDSILCGPSSIVFGGLLQQPDTSAIAWRWTFGNNTVYQVQNPPVQQYNMPGMYPMQLIIANSSGCADTVNRRITIYPLPQTYAGKDTSICLGTAATLLAAGADFYDWTPVNFLSCIACDNPVATLPGSEMLYVKGKNIFGCEITDSVFVTVKKPFHLLAIPLADSICINQSVQLNASGTENYSWMPPLGLSNAGINNPVASPGVNTVYRVIGFDSSNCFYDTAFINISVFPYPTVNAGADKTINIGTSTLLPVSYSNDVVKWLWTPAASLSCSNCAVPVALPTANTTYTVQVTNNGGCITTDNIRVTVECNNNNLFLPTAFTPDGNGRNDIFYPMGVGLFRIQSLRIFNRWGEPVFERSNFLPNDRSAGWNGTYKGKTAPAGNYVYVIETICNNNIVLSRQGNILLLK